MKKKLVMLLLVATFAFCGCNKEEDSTTIVTVENGFKYRIFVDTETGVMYLRPNQAGIVPMFNADGTLKIWEGE